MAKSLKARWQASVPMRMNGPSGRWLVRVVRCNANCAPPYTPARTNAATVPVQQRLPADPAQRNASAGGEVGIFPN